MARRWIVLTPTPSSAASDQKRFRALSATLRPTQALAKPILAKVIFEDVNLNQPTPGFWLLGCLYPDLTHLARAAIRWHDYPGGGILHAQMKHRIVHLLQKYVFNPPIKLLFALGVVPPGYALLETIGRTTGKPRRTPIGDGRVGDRLWLVAEHGMKAGYVRNIAKNPHVRVKLRNGFRARWHTGTAHLMPDDDPRERQCWLYRQSFGTITNTAALRFFGTKLLTMRIDLD